MDKVFLFLFVAILFCSCDDFDGEQEIPSYVKFDGFEMVDNPDITPSQTEDMLTSDVRDVWLYVDNIFIGAYPLPCSIPVLKEGKHKIDLRPGVIYNGMNNTREAYPFYTTVIDTLDLVPGKEVEVTRNEIMYDSDKMTIPFLESFEDPYIGFQQADFTNDNPEKMIVISSNDSVRYGASCGAIYYDVNGKNKYISVDSIHCTNTNGVVLELDYHCNVPFEVGIYGKSGSSSTDSYVSAVRITPNHSKGWQKMYVILGKVWGQLGYPSDFRFYLELINQNGISGAYVHIDNVKLIHFPNQY